MTSTQRLFSQYFTFFNYLVAGNWYFRELNYHIISFTLANKSLTKKDHINYWIETAQRDWRTIRNMLKTREYVPALFWSHLMLEKLLKAHWVKDNKSNHPPKIHNLIILIGKTNLIISENDLEFLAVMNQFQLEGRYPDYIQGVYKTYKAKQTNQIIERVTQLRKCLLKDLL